MYRKRMTIAAASVTACAFVGSLGSAHSAVAVGAVSASIDTTIAVAATASIPVRPQHDVPRRPRGGDSRYFTIDESGKRSLADIQAKVSGVIGDAYDSAADASCATVAADDVLALRIADTDHRAARAPPWA